MRTRSMARRANLGMPYSSNRSSNLPSSSSSSSSSPSSNSNSSSPRRLRPRAPSTGPSVYVAARRPRQTLHGIDFSLLPKRKKAKTVTTPAIPPEPPPKSSKVRPRDQGARNALRRKSNKKQKVVGLSRLGVYKDKPRPERNDKP